MVSVLERRLQLQATRTRPESEQGSGTVENAAVSNALASGLEVDAGDATLFVEGAVSDDGIEDFLFAFCCLRGWQKVDREAVVSAQETVEVMPIYALMKHMFLPRPIRIGGEDLVTVKPDKLAFGLLRAGAVSRAAERAVQRLRGARMRPIVVPHYFDGDTTRLAGAMLIPVRTCTRFHETVLHPES
jgi:CRISPR-associated protein Csx17